MSNLYQQLGGTGGMITYGLISLGFFGGLLGVSVAGPWPVMLYLGLWGLILGVFWHYVYGPLFTASRILKTGEDGIAKIITLTETGTSLKSGGSIAKPGVRLTLKVRPTNGKPEYEATVNTFLSMFEMGQYQPGKELNVKIDRNNPQKVAILGQVGPLQTYSGS